MMFASEMYLQKCISCLEFLVLISCPKKETPADPEAEVLT